MSPKHRPPQEPNPDQGSFFDPQPVGNGLTDAHAHQVAWELGEPIPDGVFTDPEGTAPSLSIAEANLAIEATKTVNRRRGQLGKHSPLQRDGTYLSIRLGDVLPPDESLGREKPFIVKERNIDNARLYAEKLEEKRLKHIQQNPTLDTIRVSDVIQVVADGFDLNKALEAAQNIKKPADDTPPDELPRFNTLSSRLAVIIDEAEQARYVPGSRSEITTALALLDRTEGGTGETVEAATYGHLMETKAATEMIVGRKGYPSIVKEWYADRAVASRCYELIDSYEDAAASSDAITDFTELMRSVETDESRGELIASQYHPAMGVVVRHIVAHQLKNEDISEEDLFFRPFTATEERSYRLSDLPTSNTIVAGKRVSPQELQHAKAIIVEQVRRRVGDHTDDIRMRRNKTLVTPFTNPDMPDAVRAFIHRTFAAIPLDELRELIPVVAENQWRREQFGLATLNGVRGKYRDIVQPTLDRAAERRAVQ